MLGRTHLGTTKIPARDLSLIVVVEEKMDIRNRPLYHCMSFTFRRRVLCSLTMKFAIACQNRYLGEALPLCAQILHCRYDRSRGIADILQAVWNIFAQGKYLI